MSTSSDIASLASDLVVFLAALTLLAVLMLRPDLIRVNFLGRSVLAAAATLLAASSVLGGALTDADVADSLVPDLRSLGVVLLAVGCLGVGARWPRAALLASLALFAAAEVGFRQPGQEVGDLLRFLGGCGIGLSLWLAARRSLATRIAATAGVLLVAVVLVLSGVLSSVLRDNVAEQAIERASDRARVEAGLVEEKANLALSQASFIAKVFQLAPAAQDAIKRDDVDQIRTFLEALQGNYTEVDFLAYFNSQKQLRASAKRGDYNLVLAQMQTSRVVEEAFQSSLASPAGTVEPTLDQGLAALGIQVIQFPDDRGIQTKWGAVVAGFFVGNDDLLERLDKPERENTNLSIVVDSDTVLATTFPQGELKGSFSLLDGPSGRRLIETVLGRGQATARQGELNSKDVFVAVAPIRPDGGRAGGPRPSAAIAVTLSADVIGETRASLFQTLFFVALGAAALALVLAAATGSRLGAPLRRLAAAASQISQGDLSVRTGLRSPDEIGLLGASFDEMAGSVERMASELREAAAQMEAVLNSMTDALVAADPVGLVAMMNPAAEAMLGVRASREIGKPVVEVIRAQDRSGGSLGDRFELPNFEAWSAVGMVETRKDQLLPVALSGAPIRSESGGVLGAVYVLRDMRRELEIERAKTEFLSNISHELRTPLTPIKGYAEMLRRDRDMPEGRRLAPDKVGSFLEGILESSERLERTVDILVNFAASSAGRLVLRAEPVEVGTMVHEICERWRSRTDRHRVEELVNGRPRLMADRRLLERAIDELIDNAVKYSPEGGLVKVGAQLIGAGDNRAVEISVADEGIGIAPSDFDRVFEDFSQIDGSATRRFGGLGLGLPFVQRVVTAHNGTIDATSEPGRGSTFVIRIPISTASGIGNGRSAA
jgi:PAS domain S-box-containing protein